MVTTISTTCNFNDLVVESLRTTASRLRAALIETDLARLTQTAATITSHADPQPSHPSGARSKVPCLDLKASSWAKETCCTLDFGDLLDVPMAVRRPAFEAWEGLVYFMPKAANGDIAVAVCLREKDFMRLTRDAAFMELCSFVG